MQTTKAQISLFDVVRCLDSIIPVLAIAEISRPYLVSVAEQAGSSHTCSQTPEDRFSHDVAQMMYNNIFVIFISAEFNGFNQHVSCSIFCTKFYHNLSFSLFLTK